MADLVSVLRPFDYVCKQTDAAKSQGTLKTVRIYDIKLRKKEGMKFLKRLKERTRQAPRKELEGPGKDLDLEELVPRYIERLREEVRNNVQPETLREFQRIAEDMLQTDSARFSFITTKADNCFVGLVRKELEETTGNIVEMMIYFLEDGVKKSNTEEEEGAVGGDAEGEAEEEQRQRATLVLPHDWRKSFAKSLENNIHLCHRHIRPALEALRLGRNSYADRDGKICKFNSSGGDRKLVQGRKIFQSKLSYKLHGKNPHGKSYLCKVHLNGEGSDCYLVYVDQNYKQMGRVFLLVGVFTHSECGVRKGAKKKEHATQRGGDTMDITQDMEAAEEFLEQPNT
ncbi:uncharacterized protein LOC144882468 [Branchiostoma floridae x Branchiostoma japonicum]